MPSSSLTRAGGNSAAVNGGQFIATTIYPLLKLNFGPGRPFAVGVPRTLVSRQDDARPRAIPQADQRRMASRVRYLLIGGAAFVTAVGLIGSHFWGGRSEVLKPDDRSLLAEWKPSYKRGYIIPGELIRLAHHP